MKLKELITKVNKSGKFKDKIYIGDFAETMGLDADYLGLRNYDDQEKLTSYFIGSWYCTDAIVGYKVYFLNDVPVAITSQSGRKCDEEIQWLSKSAYETTKAYVLSFQEKEDDYVNIIDLDSNMPKFYKIYFNNQLFNYHLDIPIFNGEKVKIIKQIKDESGFGIGKKVIIQKQDKSKMMVNLDELDFPFNLIETE